MKENSKLDAAQRKALLEQLSEYSGGVYKRAKERHDAGRDSFKNQLYTKLAHEQGVDKVLVEVKQLKAKLFASEHQLNEAGFSVDSSGNFDLNYNAPDEWERSVEGQVEKEFGTQDAVFERQFETARVKLLLATTVEEAERIVEPLLNLEVTVK
jgi:hypothetical protein